MKRIVLISCVKTKLPYPAKAKSLYISTLFKLSFSYAQTLNPDAIYILSAKYGLVDCEQEVDTYDITLNQMAVTEIRRWADRTHTGDNQLRSRLKQHFIKQNKDRSIFRKNIGRALLNKDKDPFLKDWELDLTSRRAIHSSPHNLSLALDNQLLASFCFRRTR